MKMCRLTFEQGPLHRHSSNSTYVFSVTSLKTNVIDDFAAAAADDDDDNDNDDGDDDDSGGLDDDLLWWERLGYIRIDERGLESGKTSGSNFDLVPEVTRNKFYLFM